MRYERGYWKDNNNIKKELDSIKNEYGDVTWKLLRSLKKNALMSALTRQGGSFYEEYPEYRVKSTTKPKGFYQDIDNIKKELEEIHNIYGCIPPKDILNKISSLHSIHRFGFSLSKIIKEMYPKECKISRLEEYCKCILDKHIKNQPFIDNGRKCLFNYGIDLQNKETKQWFQIDRYYINQRVAIEIQGKQHYSAGKNSKTWTQARTNRVKEIDSEKEDILKKCDVYLIKIKWTLATEENILEYIKKCGRFSA